MCKYKKGESIPGTEIQANVAVKAVGKIIADVQDELDIPDPDEATAIEILEEEE